MINGEHFYHPNIPLGINLDDLNQEGESEDIFDFEDIEE